MKKGLLIVIGALMIGLVLVFSQLNKAEKSSQTSKIGSPQQDGAEKMVAKKAPDFTAEKLGGGTITLGDYLGKEPIILDFWASWCPNCQRDMPVLNRYYNQYKDQLEVIGVNLQENKTVAEKFYKEYEIDFPSVYDPNSKITNDFGVTYTNFHILINKEGQITKVIPGDISEEDIKSLLQL